MGRAKYKPAVRRVKRAAIDAEKATIERWTAIAEKHHEGSMIRSKALSIVRVAELRLQELREWDTP